MNGRISRFVPRQRQRSPDRKASRDRRRMLGGSSALPDSLRQYYTEGQRAVLCIVVGEIKQRHGVCDLPIDKIAALAGVCRTTVQTTIHEARRLGHLKITERPIPGRKHLPNVVEIVSAEWRALIRRAPSAARRIGSNSVKMVSTTKSIDSRKEGARNESDRSCAYGPSKAAGSGRCAALSTSGSSSATDDVTPGSPASAARQLSATFEPDLRRADLRPRLASASGEG